MNVSFIVPLYNAERTVAETLTTIWNQKAEGVPFEILVVDDGSTDGSREVVQCLNLPIKRISKPHGGEASALNEGLRQCSSPPLPLSPSPPQKGQGGKGRAGDFIAIVEADVELYPGWLETLLREFDDPAVMGAGGYLVTPEEDPWIARLAGYEVERKFAEKERYPKHITSANALYRREAFDLFGNFDEGLRNASLDSDFNSRIVSGGYKLAYTPRAKARHHYKPTFLGYLKRQYTYARYRMYVRNLDLYPADRFLRYNVGFCGLMGASLILSPYYPQVTLGMILLAFLMQIPQMWGLRRKHRDRALLLYPIVMVLRNIVAFVGYVIGGISLRFSARR